MLKPVVIGTSHQVAPVELRERLAIARDALPESLAKLDGHVEQGALLSTCNRTELLACVPEDTPQADLLTAFHRLRNSFGDESDIPFYVLEGEPAVQHLFHVAAERPGSATILRGIGAVVKLFELADAHHRERDPSKLSDAALEAEFERLLATR